MKKQPSSQFAKSSLAQNTPGPDIQPLDDEQASELMKKLDSQPQISGWREVLIAFSETGVLNSPQIQTIIHKESVQTTRFLEQANATCGKVAPIYRLKNGLKRPGFSGRPPNTYLLAEGGAALLRQMGYPDAHACGLTSDLSILHALAMSDIHLAAKAAGLEVITDRNLAFEPRRTLRPDHRIILAGNRLALFEVEQSASLHNLPRIIESLKNKADFFQSPQGKTADKEIRMLVHLPRNKEFEKTLQIWQKAAGEVWKGNSPNLRLLAIPILEFLDHPEWESTRKLEWVDVLADSSLTVAQPEDQPSQNLLNKMAYGKTNLDRVVLSALWQEFQKNTKDVILDPNPGFFELLGLIYAASHHESNSAIKNAAYPKASIYLLKAYLDMHPELRNLLNKTIQRGQGTMRWSQATIVYRVQSVIRNFLSYHGFGDNGALLARAYVRTWNHGPGPIFDIQVRIRNPRLLINEDEEDPILPDDETVAYYETALQWVLNAFIIYAERLALKSLDFS